MAYTSFPTEITDEWLAEQKARCEFVDAQPKVVQQLVEMAYMRHWTDGDQTVDRFLQLAAWNKAAEPSPYIEAYTDAAGEYAMACEYNG